jgi:hypothetical protein
MKTPSVVHLNRLVISSDLTTFAKQKGPVEAQIIQQIRALTVKQYDELCN